MSRTESVKTRVARGVRWLDRNVPGWEQRIKVRQFDIRSGCRCVLGQVFAKDSPKGRYGFDVGVDRLWEDRTFCTPIESVEACGFDTTYGGCGDEYDALGEEWLKVIRERKARGK